MNKNLKLIVVCGGVSSEREISLKSGASVYAAFVRLGYPNVELFDLTKDNIAQLIDKKPEAVYLALHGKGGEDGCIQGLLELAGIPYTGPGVAASAVCMNKILTKRVLDQAGLPTAKFLVFDRRESTTDEIRERVVKEIGLPAVFKSPCEGSSIGVVMVHGPDEVDAAVNEVFSHGDVLLVEAFVKGVEITIPVMGNEQAETLPIIEITSQREFYDYKAKYTSGLCRHIIPACISKKEAETAEAIAKRAYKVLGCCGLSRIDFIVGESGPVVIEVNTLPGMTDMSLFPDAARYVGISFDDLVERILEYGLKTARGIL